MYFVTSTCHDILVIISFGTIGIQLPIPIPIVLIPDTFSNHIISLYLKASRRLPSISISAMNSDSVFFVCSFFVKLSASFCIQVSTSAYMP